MDVPPGFELYRRGTRRAWVRIAPSGRMLYLSAAAWDRLGRPAAVVFLVERDRRLIGFRPAAPGEANAYRVTGRAHAVSATLLLRAMAPARTGRYCLRASPGMPAHISLGEASR